MSECVVRMEMPKGCGYCRIAQFGYCGITHEPVADAYMGYPEKRPKTCPIICQLPEGHGRLGDLDELLNLMFHYDDYYGAKEAHDLDLILRDSICYAIENAPTIVPAEAERSET